MRITNYFISVRNVKKNHGGEVRFGNEPGSTRYLEVPDEEEPHPERHRVSRADWLKKVLARAKTGRHDDNHPRAGYSYGDILTFVHGYNDQG